MPKRHQQDSAKSVTGHNNPSKTTEHTHEHSELEVTHKANSREREEDRESRNGSESNAAKHRKGSHVHEHDHEKDGKQHKAHNDDSFSDDLRSENTAGENQGPRNYESTLDYSRTAYDIKSMHQILADLTDDELKSIVLVSEGSRLQQGAKYIDLEHLEQGEFVAEANMIAEAGHSYVPKKEVDYVLWNRLNQVDDPTRLDESDNA